MKKVLLTLVAVVATTFFAVAESVTFDFSNPATWGYEATPSEKSGAGAEYVSTKPIVMEPVTITVDTKDAKANGGKLRFWFPQTTSTAAKDFRCSSTGGKLGQTLTFSADGNTITEIKFTAAKFALKANVGTLSAYANKTATWTGSAKEVVFTTTEANTLNSIEVTYSNDSGDTRQPAGLAWSESAITVRTNEIADFTAPTLTNPNNVAVTYSSENTDVATVTEAGAVTLTGKTGSAKITSTFAGDTTYKPAVVSYTINVKIAVPTTDSSLDNPYTVEEVLAIIETLGTASKNNVYVKGIVKGSPAPKINTTYKSLTYYISDDLANATAGSIQVYSGKYFNGGDFTNDNILKEGDEVIVKGTIKSFNGTPEVDKNNELVSLNGQLAPTVEATEVNSIAETIALAETTPVKVNFPLTVAFVNDSNVFATDAAGDFIQLYGPNTLKVGDVIPAGWEGTFKLHNNVTPEIEINELPTPTEGTFTAKEVAAADITTALVNHVITIKNVDFEAATPADVANFTGMVGDTELSFRNNYSRESVEAGKYDVTVVVTIFNNAPSLYVVKYTKAETDSVIGIEAGDNAAPVEYYNLQGVRVDNPANGIFIRRQGSKAQKIVI